MVDTTLGTLRREALRRLGKEAGLIIPNAFFDAAAAGSITSANLLRNSNWGPSHFQTLETVIYRGGAASAADYARYAGALTVATGLLAHTGANYADTTVGTEIAELWYHGVRPDMEVLDAINRCMREVYFDTWIPLSHLSSDGDTDLDGDMSASGTTAWTAATGATLSKTTTSIYTPYGLRSLRVLNDSTNDYAQSSTVRVTQASPVQAMAIASVATGPDASLVLYDVTNSAAITAANAISSDEETPQLLFRAWENVPATCKRMALRLQGTAAASDIYWGGAWLYRQDDLIVPLPSFVTEHYQKIAIMQARPLVSRTGSNVYDARSFDMIELKEGQDYKVRVGQSEAIPDAVIFNSLNAYNWPLFIQARRPHSDRVTFTVDTETTEAPPKQLVPRIVMEMIETIYLSKFPDDAHWKSVYGAAAFAFDVQTAARPIEKVSSKPYFAGPQLRW